MKTVSLIIVGVIVAVLAPLFLLSSSTQIEANAEVLGVETPVTVTLRNPHGVRLLRIVLEQGTSRSEWTQEEAARRVFFIGRSEGERTMIGKIEAKPDHGFQTGPAKLTVEAVSNDFRAKKDSITKDVRVDIRPPRIVADGLQHYINQGGSELVTFQVAGYWTEAGIRVGKYTFRSFEMPGAKNANQRFALFAYPWDLPPNVVPVVYVKGAGNTEVTTQFWFKLFPKSFRKREIELNERFVQKVIGELDPNGGGTDIDRFLRINRQMRQENNKTLADLRLKSEQKVLWRPPFQQLSNSKVEAQFADVRTYIFEGKKVDEQVHLGFDLSVTANVPVVASNDGKIVYADHLGIYGNCIVIDHGFGLQSIYAHLSSIDAKVGDMVKRGEAMGKSGSTGMAGGDHLHFSMQVDGVQVNAVEWWDSHWIQDRIASKLPGLQ